jgi:RNA polymerase sporulation-specific sigma factor
LEHNEDKLNLLALRAQEGDSNAFNEILRLLEPELRMIAARLYISGADEQDVLQECRIGVWKAVQDHRPEKGMNFHNFAIGVCCKRRVFTAIKSANGKKHRIHNMAESLDRPIVTDEDDGGQTLADFIVDRGPSPLDIILHKQEYDDNVGELSSRMTDMEARVFASYAKDQTYSEIGEELEINPKAADNALIRIRKKGHDVYREYNGETPPKPKKARRKHNKLPD